MTLRVCIRCDYPGCAAELDGFPAGLSWNGVRAFAAAYGWRLGAAEDLCPTHAVPPRGE